MSTIIINPYAHGPKYNRTPLKMLKAIPAEFVLPLHDDMFGVAGHSDAIFSNMMANGEDLRAFTSESMTPDTEIPIEVIEVTTGSNLIKGYVRIPSPLSINDKIYLRTTVGGGESAYAVTDTNGRNNVWQDYLYAAHGNALEVDVTGNHADGIDNGGDTTPASGLLNGWPAFGIGANAGTASTNGIETADFVDVDGHTESFICYKEATEGDTGGRVLQYSGRNAGVQKQATDEIQFYRDGTTTDMDLTSTGGEFTGDAWHALLFDFQGIGNASTAYVDGVELVSPTNNNGSGTYRTGGYGHLGNSPVDTAPGDVVIAEYRHRSDNVPDGTWAGLEWDGFNNPGSLAEAEALVVV